MHKDTDMTTNRLKYDSARGATDHPTQPTQRYDLDQTIANNMLLEAQGEDDEDEEEEE
jgi:hypothetical protein